MTEMKANKPMKVNGATGYLANRLIIRCLE